MWPILGEQVGLGHSEQQRLLGNVILSEFSLAGWG